MRLGRSFETAPVPPRGNYLAFNAAPQPPEGDFLGRTPLLFISAQRFERGFNRRGAVDMLPLI